MQAGSASGASGGGNRSAKKWGPIVGVVAVLAIVVGVLIATRHSGSSTKPADTGATSTTAAPGGVTTTPGTQGGSTTTAAAKPITYPLSYSQAKAQGVADQIDWGTRCDTTTGRLAVPDYFAPECYAPFKGDNGGATYAGVTADTINIVFYEGMANDPIIAYITDAIKVSDTNAQAADTMKELVRYYETYYELYGRKVNLIPYEGTGIATDEVAARADAAAIVEKYQPFVVFGGPSQWRPSGFENGTPGQPDDFYTKRDPYVWGLDGSAVQKQTHVIEFIQKQLLGKNAVHGGDAVKNTPRKFGLLYLESSGAAKDLANQFSAKMTAMGAPLAATVAYQLDPSTIQATASQVITKMKAAGVTTIVFSGDPVAPRDFTKEATAQEYFPEWVVAASTLVDVTAFARTYDPQQWKHAFGVTQLSARSDPTTSGAYSVYKWFTGKEPPAKDTIGVIAPFFAVLQYLGPDLTPQNFKAALFAAPGTTPGISQPYLSYGDKGYWGGVPDYQGVDDATVFWWDPVATGPDEIRKQGTGMYQYVDGGKRYLPGQWPTEDKLFDPNGAVDIYLTPPPGEQPKQYPSPAG